MKNYETVIGLEIHVELKTNTKVFCSCKNQFGSLPNTNCCPVCTGMPGALPVLNKSAVEKAIKAGLAVGSEINDIAIFERKNYFYPDLAKAYQISQLEKPICVGGKIVLDSGKVIRLNRIHLEEDAGKLVHRSEAIGTLIDYNRGGVPLIESVTEPDISTSEEAIEFLSKLQATYVYAGIADCKMEEGGMRCDVNLSIREVGSSKLGTRTEMKNLNSFKMVSRAIEFERKRQIEIVESGGVIKQETRKWDDNKGRSQAMRSKETSQDYRYFPDPDLLWVKINKSTVQDISKSLPLMPEKRKEKYMSEFGLPKYDAEILTSKKEISDFFDACGNFCENKKALSNWIMVDILGKLKEEPENESMPLTPKQLSTIINLLDTKKISRVNAKELFAKIWRTNLDAHDTAEKNGWLDGISESELNEIINKVIVSNQKAVEDYPSDPEKVLRFFVGQVMKETKGKANAELSTSLLKSILNK
ncbi:MAG: Asp-tRNA(Asn)/Glu-tRNA(Gln) amidotransferase subunit GatB [Clostridia bacterium]